MDKRWQKIENIVDTALTLSEEKRTDYIEQECSGDLELKSSVTELIESIEASEGYLEEPADLQNELISDFAIEDEKASSMIGEKIGPYKLVELIDHGGMGSIFIAERVDGDFDQKVALKLIRRGMDTPSNIARFKREQTILANLNHANIAQLYDGGITKEHLPYLVMEYVDGTPIDKYSQEKGLSISERINLFKSVCKAVQHAHNNLIIHRDLKPENILVKENGEVKILDFGIAKLLEPDTSQTVFQTQTGSRVLTLGYAAPEQLSGKSVTVNTDIYALGLLLYKLLTDSHPFDLKDKSIPEIETIIREESPVKPSAQGKVQKILQGDLDAIVLKAMRKEASGRYNSAGELLDDLQRYERGIPVLAHEGSTAYRIKKFFKRNKQAIAAAVIFLLSVTGLTGFYTFELSQERNQAQLEAEKAENVRNLLVDIFEANDPISSDAETATLPELLEKGTNQILDRNIDPSVKLELLLTLSTIYQNITEFDKAEQLVNESLRLSLENFGPNSVNTAKSYVKLGGIDYDLGNYQDGKKDLLKAKRILDNQKHESTPILIDLYYHLGFIEEAKSNYDSSQVYFQWALDNIQKQVRIDTAQYIDVLKNVARPIHRNGNYAKADSLMHLALKTSEHFHGKDDIITANIAGDIGLYYMTRAKYDSARFYYQSSLEIKEQLFGDEGHPSYATTLSNLGVMEAYIGNNEAAETLFTKALKIDKKIYGEDHPNTAIIKGHLAVIYLERGELQKSKKMMEEQLQVYLDSYGPEHYYLAGFYRDYGRLFSAREEYNKAEKYFQKAENIYSSYETTRKDTFAKLYEIRGENYFRMNKFKAAANQYKMAAEIFNPSRYDEYKIRGVICLIKLGESYTALNQTANAKETFDEIQARIDTTEVLTTHSEVQELYSSALKNIKSH